MGGILWLVKPGLGRADLEGAMINHTMHCQHDEKQSAEHRRAGRLRTELLKCSLGTVVDMSATGMRVRVRRGSPPKWTTKTIKLTSIDGKDRVRVRLVWVRQHGDRCFELGLHFEQVTSEGRERLQDIARIAGVQFRMDTHSGAKRSA